MRIGMILDSTFPPDYRVEKEALTLIKSGHEVILFCFTRNKPFYEEEYKGIKLAHYPYSVLEYKLSALAYTVPFYRWMMMPKIERFLNRYTPDILHVHDMVIAEAVFAVADKMKKKVVLDLHENRPASMAEYRHLKKVPGRWFIRLGVWEHKQIELVNRAENVIVVTELAKQDLLKYSPEKQDEITVVPNTSTSEFANYPLDGEIIKRMKDSFNLLYIGDTSVRRGVSDVLYAVELLKDLIADIKFWIIGTSSADNELHQLVRKLKLEKWVQFEGWQPEKLFASYITGSHVCLSPLRRNPHHDTTFANKIFQYMSLSRPVVVSDCPAQAQLIKDEACGLVHEAGDVQDIARQILTLYNERELQSKLGKNAGDAVRERWNWDTTSVALGQLYEKLSGS